MLWNLSLRHLVSSAACLSLMPLALHGGEQPFSMQGWVPPAPAQWTALAPRLAAAYEQAKKQFPGKRLDGGAIPAPKFSVDRTNGRLYVLSGMVWVSTDCGQTYEVIDKEALVWGFNESTTAIFAHPDGSKVRVFSSNQSGYTLDSGATWKHLKFNIPYGFEDGQINWDGDGKLIVGRHHCSRPAMHISRDGGDSFTKFPDEINQQINTLSIAVMDDDVMLFQGPKLVRTEDSCKTFTEVPQPTRLGADGKPGRFDGMSVRFKNKVYWLHSTGIYTSADKGLTWTVVGKPFPADAEWMTKRLVRSGPVFGKDEKHMLLLCLDRVVETLDGGETWHVLAQLPITLNDMVWAHGFTYDPISDVLFSSNMQHGCGPYLFGRLALNRWGKVEQVPPSAPTDVQSKVVRAGNCAELSWKPSNDASGIYSYYVYVDGDLQYRTEKPEIVLSNYSWDQQLKVGVQAVDAWGNRSAVVEQAVRMGAKPAAATLLSDLKSSIATIDDAPMELVTNTSTVPDKRGAPLMLHVDGYEPNPETRRVHLPVPYGFGVRLKNTQKLGVLEYDIDQKFTRLLLDVGVRSGAWARIEVKILLDGKQVAVTKADNSQRDMGQKADAIDLDLTNVKKLRFEFANLKTPYWQWETAILGNAVVLGPK